MQVAKMHVYEVRPRSRRGKCRAEKFSTQKRLSLTKSEQRPRDTIDSKSFAERDWQRLTSRSATHLIIQ